MHNLESVLENEMHKLLWDFEIETNHVIAGRRSNLVINTQNKTTCRMVNILIPDDHKVNLKESENKGKYLDFA